MFTSWFSLAAFIGRRPYGGKRSEFCELANACMAVPAPEGTGTTDVVVCCGSEVKQKEEASIESAG